MAGNKAKAFKNKLITGCGEKLYSNFTLDSGSHFIRPE
jgi:hypothetical protein